MKLILRTIGSDPEFFIRDIETKEFVPSAIITHGTKDFPEQTDTEDFFIHKDNLTVEGNIPPAGDLTEFTANMKLLKGIIETLANMRGCELVCDDIAKFPKKYLELEDAKEFACSSFINAWTNEEVKTPKLTEDFRTAGFHIHLGYDISFSEEEIESGENLVMTKREVSRVIGKAFDLFLTLQSDATYYCRERREGGYGSYGAIRHTPYGVECRALGSHFSKDQYLNWVGARVETMFNWLNLDNNVYKLRNISPKVVNGETLAEIQTELLFNKQLVYGEPIID